MKGESAMKDTGRVLITGATGNIGTAVLDNLGTTDLGLRALVHDESKARTMRDRDVEAFVCDFLEPESLAPALEGVSQALADNAASPRAGSPSCQRDRGSQGVG
jgi:uncharacterized protein YbjT (DUF2867 family)